MSFWSNIASAFIRDLALRGCTARTQETYRQDLGAFLRYLDTSGASHPGEITLDLLRGYQTHLYETPGHHGARLSIGTQARYLSVVRSFASYLCGRGLTLTDAGRGLAMPKLQRRLPAVILTTREVLQFLKAIDTRTPLGVRDRAIFETLYSTGLRVGELVALTPADVDLDQGFVRVRRAKGGKARVVPLGRIAARWITRYLDGDRKQHPVMAPLFLSAQRHQAMCRKLLSMRVAHWTKMAGLKKRITCHSFRHACATHLLRGRASLRHIQELLGHASPTTTQIYTHVEILDLKRVHQRCHPRSRR